MGKGEREREGKKKEGKKKKRHKKKQQQICASPSEGVKNPTTYLIVGSHDEIVHGIVKTTVRGPGKRKQRKMNVVNTKHCPHAACHHVFIHPSISRKKNKLPISPGFPTQLVDGLFDVVGFGGQFGGKLLQMQQ